MNNIEVEVGDLFVEYPTKNNPDYKSGHYYYMSLMLEITKDYYKFLMIHIENGKNYSKIQKLNKRHNVHEIREHPAWIRFIQKVKKI